MGDIRIVDDNPANWRHSRDRLVTAQWCRAARDERVSWSLGATTDGSTAKAPPRTRTRKDAQGKPRDGRLPQQSYSLHSSNLQAWYYLEYCDATALKPDTSVGLLMPNVKLLFFADKCIGCSLVGASMRWGVRFIK